MNQQNLDNLSAVLSVYKHYHNGVISRLSLQKMGVPMQDPDVQKLISDFKIEVCDNATASSSSMEELEVLKIMASGPDCNQYAKWRIIDILSPLFYSRYRKNSFYTAEEHYLVCVEIACQIIDKYDDNFLGALKLRLNDVESILYNETNDNMGVTSWQYIKKVAKERANYIHNCNTEPSAEELSRLTGYSVARVRTYLNILDARIVSIDSLKDSTNKEPVCNSNYVESIEDAYEKKCEKEAIMHKIRELGDEMAIDIVLNKFGFEGHEMLQRDVMKKWGIGRKKYHQILSKSMDFLRKSLAEFA